jgi:hypothetical protein
VHVLLLVIDYAKCRLRMSSNDSAATGLLLLSRYHVGIGLRIQQSPSSSQQKRRFGGLFFFCAANMTRALAALCIPYTTHFNGTQFFFSLSLCVSRLNSLGTCVFIASCVSKKTWKRILMHDFACPLCKICKVCLCSDLVMHPCVA